jgi:hypothetical protein
MEDIALSLYYTDGKEATVRLYNNVPPLRGMEINDQVQKNKPLCPIMKSKEKKKQIHYWKKIQ